PQPSRPPFPSRRSSDLGRGGVAAEGFAAGRGGLVAGDLEGEDTLLAVLQAGLGEVPVRDRAAHRVLREAAGDVAGGGADLLELQRVLRCRGDRILLGLGALLLRGGLLRLLGGGIRARALIGV